MASRQLVNVNLDTRAYQIVVTTDAFDDFPKVCQNWYEQRTYLKGASRRCLIVTDTNVSELYAQAVSTSLFDAGWQSECVTVPAGEPSKSLEQATRIYDALVEMRADRRTLVIAVGGGVVGDLAGFAAATFARGIPFVQVPTTLLAAVDSAVGGKVGINHPRGKNLIGAFHQPLGVYIDTSTLKTLPDRDYRSGLAEVVKYGMILDDEFFSYLEQNVSAISDRDPQVLVEIVTRSCRLKADVVEQDEYEQTGLRAILNYGHTFAHAYEALCGYGELMHGEAVSIGMVDAAQLAVVTDRFDPAAAERQLRLLKQLNLMTDLPETVSFSIDDVLERMKLDKKNVNGQLRFVLPDRIGRVKIVPGVPEPTVRGILEPRIQKAGQ